NQALVSMSGFPREEIIELPCEESVCIQPIDQCPVPGGRSEGGCETELRTASGQRIPVLRAVRSVHIDGEAHFLATIIDISALKAMEKRVIQAEKMESLGQLAAGIAHEINTPTQYIGDNTRFLGETFPDLDGILGVVEELLEAEQAGDPIDKVMQDIRDLIEDSDLKFLREEIPRAIEQTLEGVERISKIVGSMKQFAHPGTAEMVLVDLNEAIDRTVTVARNEWKYVADLETNLAEDLPPVPCVQGESNQVLLNLVINAAHAIADAITTQDNKKGWITISSNRAGNSVEVSVSDTGTGIPEAVRPKIFDPFYTTKQVGKGTGQGLAIAHKVVVEKHHGEILVDTEAGKGTTFTIRLPLQQLDMSRD
ncbi:MAG: ATP-binding protein, partial [Desulfovibrionales bacterium]